MELAFERRGTGSPLVLLHGIGHHWQAWLPVLDRLAAERDVIAVDFPGFGVSPPLPSGTPYTAESLADAIESFFAVLGLRDPHVAGSSLGGRVALELAARAAVRSATAFSPAGFWNRGELAYTRAVLGATRASARALSPAGALALAEDPMGRVLSMSLMVARPAKLSPEAMLAALQALRDASGFDETLASFARLTPPAPPKVPVTIAWGERDRLLPRRQAIRAARWSGRRVKLLSGCGHLPMTDDPELVASVLLEGSAQDSREARV